MTLKIQIQMDNAAFADSPGLEVARLLRDLADTVEYENLRIGYETGLRDVNGNRVGEAKVTRS